MWLFLVVGMAAVDGPMDDLDFWLGRWEVSWTNAQGEKEYGTNYISRTLDGAVIEERFESKGLRGRSFSLVDPLTGEWRQTWVDNQRGYLVFRGRVIDGVMTFQTDPETTEDGRTLIKRMIWREVKGDSMVWLWQRRYDDGVWETTWRIDYRRF